MNEKICIVIKNGKIINNSPCLHYQADLDEYLGRYVRKGFIPDDEVDDILESMWELNEDYNYEDEDSETDLYTFTLIDVSYR